MMSRLCFLLSVAFVATAFAQNQQTLASADALRVRGKNAEAERLYRLVADRNSRQDDDEPLQIAAHKGLALLYQSTSRRQQAFDEQTTAMSLEQEQMTHIMERGVSGPKGRQFVSYESQMRDFLPSATESLEVLISMLAEDLTVPRAGRLTARQSTVEREALAWTLLRKGMMLDTLARMRWEGQPGARSLQRVRDLRTQISELALNPPPVLDQAARAKLRDKLQHDVGIEEDIIALENRTRPDSGAIVDSPLQVGDLFRFSGETELDRLASFTPLPPNTILVEYLRSRVADFQAHSVDLAWKPPHYYAFVLAPGRTGPAKLVDLGDAAAIEAAIKDVRRNILEFTAAYVRDAAGGAFEKQKEAEYRVRSQRLHDLAFAPLREVIGTPRTVYIAPDGELNRISFEALGYGGPSPRFRYLADDYRFIYLSTGRDLAERPEPTGRGTVVFADPDYDMGAEARRQIVAGLTRGSLASFARDIANYQPWPPLHASGHEAELVERELANSSFGPVTAYLGDKAIEERLLAVQSPRILHIATHGFFLPAEQTANGGGLDDPLLRSGILLAGANTLGKESRTANAKAASGWVTAEVLMSLDLRDTQLVVLSGCDTGLGDIQNGEGVFGLRRAFRYAGARNLLVSLYKVPDDETVQLMSGFYESLKAGRGIEECFHNGQMAVRTAKLRKDGVAHPFFWSSFVVVQ